MNRKSFTLVELIVVIAIIAILAAIIAPNVFRAIEKAKIAAAMEDFKTYKKAIYAFYADTGTWPLGWNDPRESYYYCCEDNGLITNLRNWPGWDGPYLEKIKSQHPWGGVYCLEYNNLGRSSQRELFLEYNRCCYPSHVHSYQPCRSDDCFVPICSAQRIDTQVDDGNLYSGDFFYQWSNPQGRADITWVLVWDTF